MRNYDWPQVHALIQAMTRNEKGYFRKSQEGFGAGTDSQYMRLYDLLEKQKSFNLLSIKKVFTGQGINLTSTRNHLMQQLLRSLRNYTAEQSDLMQLRELLDHVELLEKKGLHEACIELTEEGLAIAEKNNWLPYVILLLNRQRSLINLMPEKDRDTKAGAIYRKTVEAGTTFHINTRVSYTHGRIAALVNTYYPLRDDVIRDEVLSLIGEMHELLQEPGITSVAASTIHATLALANRLLARFEVAIQHQKLSMLPFEDSEMVKNKSRQFYAAWYNLIALYTLSGDYKTAFPMTRNLLQLPTFSSGDEQFVEAIYCHQYIACKLGANEKISSNDIAHFDTFFAKPPVLKGVYEEALYKYASLHLEADNAKACLQNVMQLRNQFSTHTLISLQVHIRLLEIAAHYQLQHMQLIPALIRSAYRFMLKHELKFTMEQTILQLFRKLLNSNSKHQVNKLLDECATNLEALHNDPYEAAAMENYFNYVKWMRNR